MAILKENLENKTWENVFNEESANKKADIFHSELMQIIEKFAPEKTRTVSNDDQPWFTEALKKIDKLRRREYRHNRRSKRYLELQQHYKIKCKQEKKKFFKKMVRQVREANPSQWYSLLKRIGNYDQEKSNEFQISEICHLSDQDQAEAIADSFNSITQEYQEVSKDDIKIPEFSADTIPNFSPWQVRSYMEKIKTNKATIPGDIPAKIMKEFASLLCVPLADIINTSIKTGSWPDRYKHELITSVGKVFPVESMKQLRPISNLPLCDKIQEKIVSEMIISDMKSKLDPTQYGNQKKTSIQHYLVRLMHRILTNVDRNMKGEINAVLATFVDWKSAYSRQCHKLGIESFIRNGVRPSLIPVLINYFQNRQMKVKFHGKTSATRQQPGSGAQGASLGNWEFISQTNHNADSVPEEDRFKYIDDLTVLEIINLLNIGLSSYNFKNQVASDIPIEGKFVHKDNLKTQKYLNEINEWTENQKMLLSEEKTNSMIINFTNNHQFTTRMTLKDSNIQIVQKMKIL